MIKISFIANGYYVLHTMKISESNFNFDDIELLYLDINETILNDIRNSDYKDLKIKFERIYD